MFYGFYTYICRYKNDNKMKNVRVAHSEEIKGIITMFLSNGGREVVKTESIILFIEKNRFNYSNELTGNNSPLGDGNPEYDLFDEIKQQESADYLDDNFDEVCELYFKNQYNIK